VADTSIRVDIGLIDKLMTLVGELVLAGNQIVQFSTDDEHEAEGRDWRTELNPHSLEVLRAAQAEPSLASAAPGTRVQFERLGYFCVDIDSRPGALVFNRTVSLRDAWARIAQKQP
jgi:glutaminyl-tRNA synthetase